MSTNHQVIKDFNHRIIGFIDEESDGKLIARDFYRRILGKYDPKTNLTKDFYGRIVGRGNVLTMLFNMEKK